MAYKVRAVGNDGKSTREYDFDGKHYYCFHVKIDGDDTVYEVSRLKDNPPDVGQEYEKKEASSGEGRMPKLKKPISQGGYSGGGRGGGRAGGGYTPEDVAAMRRSGAQDRALKFCELKGLIPVLGGSGDDLDTLGLGTVETGQDFKRLVEFFEEHVQEAVDKVKAAGSSGSSS